MLCPSDASWMQWILACAGMTASTSNRHVHDGCVRIDQLVAHFHQATEREVCLLPRDRCLHDVSAGIAAFECGDLLLRFVLLRSHRADRLLEQRAEIDT